jgi:5-methylthioadenosine/S-adenosylhomocysteine deaminase
MFQEMDTAAKLEKVALRDPTVMPAQTVLEMATVNGARALGFEDKVGSITVGKAADLIVLDFEQPHLTPVYDYVSHLVYCARGADVLSTMVAGRWLMRERRILTLDEDAVFARVKDIAAEVRGIVKAPA